MRQQFKRGLALCTATFMVCFVTRLMVSAVHANQGDFQSLLMQLRQGGIENIDNSINDIKAFTRTNPEATKAWVLLADALMVRYQYKKKQVVDLNNALTYLNQAQQQAPNSDRILQKRALIHLTIGQYDKARVDLEQALRLAPNNLVATALKIELLLANNQKEQAESFAYQAMINWDNPEVPATEFANVFFAGEQWQVALDFYQQLNDQSAHTLFRQGLCYEHLAQHQKAIGRYQQSLRKQSSINVRHRMIELLLDTDQLNTSDKSTLALNESRILLSQQNERADTWQLFAKLYEQHGNASRALAAWVNVRRFSTGKQQRFANKRINAFATLPKMN